MRGPDCDGDEEAEADNMDINEGPANTEVAADAELTQVLALPRGRKGKESIRKQIEPQPAPKRKATLEITR
jgi:hypothetical protein